MGDPQPFNWDFIWPHQAPNLPEATSDHALPKHITQTLVLPNNIINSYKTFYANLDTFIIDLGVKNVLECQLDLALTEIIKKY